MAVRESGFIVHHNVKDPATQRAVYSEVTAKAIVLDNPKTAAAQIAEALAVCLNRMLPVYIEIPADIAEAPMVPPQFSTEPNLLRLKQFDEANAFIHDRFSDATKPVFMLGVEAVRYGLVDEISRGRTSNLTSLLFQRCYHATTRPKPTTTSEST